MPSPRTRLQGLLTPPTEGTRLTQPVVVGCQSWGALMWQICRWHLVGPDFPLEDSVKVSCLLSCAPEGCTDDLCLEGSRAIQESWIWKPSVNCEGWAGGR